MGPNVLLDSTASSEQLLELQISTKWNRHVVEPTTEKMSVWYDINVTSENEDDMMRTIKYYVLTPIIFSFTWAQLKISGD
jgi:hypothetical protein